jgi:hypothetical protein
MLWWWIRMYLRVLDIDKDVFTITLPLVVLNAVGKLVRDLNDETSARLDHDPPRFLLLISSEGCDGKWVNILCSKDEVTLKGEMQEIDDNIIEKGK